jgi:hypothetical protein
MPKFVNRHPPIGSEDRSQLWIQKMTQCQVKTKVYLVEPKDLDYLQIFSFKGGSHLGNPKPFFLFSLSKSRGRDSF